MLSRATVFAFCFVALALGGGVVADSAPNSCSLAPNDLFKCPDEFAICKTITRCPESHPYTEVINGYTVCTAENPDNSFCTPDHCPTDPVDPPTGTFFTPYGYTVNPEVDGVPAPCGTYDDINAPLSCGLLIFEAPIDAYLANNPPDLSTADGCLMAATGIQDAISSVGSGIEVTYVPTLNAAEEYVTCDIYTMDASAVNGVDPLNIQSEFSAAGTGSLDVYVLEGGTIYQAINKPPKAAVGSVFSR